MESRARKWVEAGYRHLKIKFVGRAAEDLELIARIRKAVGPDVELSIDANSSYGDFDATVRLVESLAPYDVAVFEDVFEGSLDDLHRLRERIRPKLMLDAQAYWPNVLAIAWHGAADAFNLHARNVGGLDTALAIDALARAAGIETRMGATHLLGIGSAAFQILGSVIALTMPVEDLGPLRFESHYGASIEGYESDDRRAILKAPLSVKNGCILIPDTPGLGVDVDRRKLARMTENVVELK
jgi:L-alanine-DL-glutamate epimerase-like enolase superfamily enzyme